MKLVVGLGNPGPEYEWTRHNVGFHVLDAVAKRERSIFEAGRKLETWTGRKEFEFARLARRDALLIKPLTFMNRSGDVVAPLVRHFALELRDLLVVYDDLDLSLGTLRIRPHGSAGTHNGMRSILTCLAVDAPVQPGLAGAEREASSGAGSFPRLRVGIGPAGTDAARHVLGRFSEREQVDIEISVAHATDAIVDWLEHGDIDRTMTRFHSRWNLGA